MLLAPDYTDREIQLDKAIAALQRICYYAIAKPSAIYSVLYYADRLHLGFSTHSLYGEQYLAYHHAAVPQWANHVYMTLAVPMRDIDLYRRLRAAFKIDMDGWMINLDMTAKGDRDLTQFERNCLDDALYWLKSATVPELIFSRRDRSWRDTERGKVISHDMMRSNGIEEPDARGVVLPEQKRFLMADREISSVAFEHVMRLDGANTKILRARRQSLAG